MEKIAVIGGGISGLTTAFYLKKAGLEVTIFEKNRPGGAIKSMEMEGTIFDLGPNSLRDKTGDLTALVEDVGIAEDLLNVSEAFKTRCIVRHGKIQYLKPSPLTPFTTPVLSTKGKFRILAEPFKKGITDGDTEEDVATFLTRRIGREAVDFLVDPIYSGIYAGDISRLSKQEIMPKLADFEANFGSIFKGVRSSPKKKKEAHKPKASVFNFKGGLQTLTNALASYLDAEMLKEEVTQITKSDNGYLLTWRGKSAMFDRVISCIPAYVLSTLISDLDLETAHTLESISYSPILTTQLIFDKKKLGEAPEGFGFLVPRKENIRLLGAIWKSSIFPDLASENAIHFNLMTGGAHDQFNAAEIPEVERQVIAEFSQLMGYKSSPTHVHSTYWEKAIPQYNVGYRAVRTQLNRFGRENPNFTIAGNFVWGISVPECISKAKSLALDMT